jgi:hypothetical protein
LCIQAFGAGPILIAANLPIQPHVQVDVEQCSNSSETLASQSNPENVQTDRPEEESKEHEARYHWLATHGVPIYHLTRVKLFAPNNGEEPPKQETLAASAVTSGSIAEAKYDVPEYAVAEANAHNPDQAGLEELPVPPDTPPPAYEEPVFQVQGPYLVEYPGGNVPVPGHIPENYPDYQQQWLDQELLEIHSDSSSDESSDSDSDDSVDSHELYVDHDDPDSSDDGSVGDDPDEEESPLELLEEPEPHRYRYVEKQLIKVKKWEQHEFPDLDHLGYHNNSMLSGEEQKYVDENGLFFHQEDHIVSLPAGLVEELSEFFVDKTRDVTLGEFSVCTNLCRQILSRTTISARQQLDAIMYAPAIAYRHFWSEKSNVARVVAGDYVHSGFTESVRRIRQSWQRFKHIRLAMFVVLLTLASLWSVAALLSPVTGFNPPTGPISVVQPDQSIWCALQPLYPHVHLWHPTTLVSVCTEQYYQTQTWILSKHSILLLHRWFGCDWSLDYLWYGVSVDNPSCPSYVFSQVRFTTRKAWNRLMHALNGNRMAVKEMLPSSLLYRGALRKLSTGVGVSIATYCLENCAHLPKPRQLKPGARVSLGEGELRGNLRRKLPMQCKGRQVVYGFDTKSYSPTAFASNQHNEEQALYARVVADTVVPDAEELGRCIRWIRANHRVLFPRMGNVQSVPWEEYLARSNASPSVKRMLRATMIRLQQDGITEDSDLGQVKWKLENGRGGPFGNGWKPVFSNTVRKWTTRSSFVKVENNLYDSPLGTKDKAPRLIQGASAEFICLVGPWVMAVQDRLKRRWNLDNNIVFTSGMTGEKLAQAFTEKAGGRILEDDLGKFDCSIRLPWCVLELWLFKKWGAPLAVLQLVEGNMMTHGYTHHGWKYSCYGTRKSGDPYTSLMNSVINGVSHLYLYCKWTNKTVKAAQQSLFMLVQGDDNCMWHRELTTFPWRQGMAWLGFDSTASYRVHYDEIEFCSCRLYKTTEGYVFGPKPGKVLAKFGYIINPPANVSRESMMRGVALGLKCNSSFIPPLKVVVDRVLELTEGHKAYFERNFFEHTVKVGREFVPDPESTLALYNQYYWSPSTQKSWAQNVSTMQLGDSYSCAYSQLLFDRDTSGLSQVFVASNAG